VGFTVPGFRPAVLQRTKFVISTSVHARICERRENSDLDERRRPRLQGRLASKNRGLCGSLRSQS
jgi:hypothetical protein